MESDKATSLQRQILTALIAAVFVLYGFRLLYLQVIISDDLDMQSARNSIKKIEKTPLRGVFYVEYEAACGKYTRLYCTHPTLRI